MTDLMWDSDKPEVLTRPVCDGQRVATYADLVTRQLADQLHGRLVVIDRGLGDPLSLATVADIEQGCLTVEQGVAAVRQWASEGRSDPTVYHDRALIPDVDKALAGFECWRWVATLDGTCSVDVHHLAATQILGADKTGFHADLSVVWHDHWHPLPAGMSRHERALVEGLAKISITAAEAVLRAART